MSSNVSPNLVEPLEYIIEAVSYIVWSTLNEPVPSTVKSPVMCPDEALINPLAVMLV